MIKILFYALVLIAGIPSGYLLSKLCRDEIKKWKKNLVVISVISSLLAITFFFLNFEYKTPVIVSLFFMTIVCMTIIWRIR